MLEAVVGVALRAILASVVLGGVLGALVLIATRALALTAATRHALWTTALLATALMPLAGVGVSVARAYAAPQLVATAPETVKVVRAPLSDIGTKSRTAHDSSALAQPPEPKSPAQTPASSPRSDASHSFASSLRDRFTFAGWTPRVTRNLAAGVVGVWLLGALIGLFGLAASILRVRGLKRRSSPLDGTLADELPWLTAPNAAREIYLRLSYETETPVAIGFRRPVILIPTELATAEGLAAIESLVLHEYAHLARHDDWTNLVQRTIERIFWFNPVVWLVGRRIALEREIASDDAVVEKTGEPHAYATSLWRLAREMRMPEHAVVAPGALLTRKQITVRIEQLLDKKRARLHRSPATALGVALAALLAVGFVATSAPAIELPRAESPLATSNAAAVPAAHTTAARRVVAWHETTHVTTPAGAAKAIAAQHANAGTTAPETTTVKTEHTIVRYQSAQSKPVVNERIVYLHDRQNSKTVPAPPADSVPVPPAPPAPPGAPAVPPVPGFGPDIAKTISAAMAAVPREIAQETGAPRKRHAKYDGSKVTREIVASCLGCSFRGSDARGVDLHGLKIVGDDFSDADLRGANLSGARLAGVSLARAKLADANLRGAAFAGVDLEGTELDGALLDNVTMAGISMQHVALRGVGLRNIMAKCTGCDFSRMDLHGEDLRGIVLNGADLSHSDLHGANLSGVRFNGVDLSHADLSGADLTNAQFAGCDLSTTNLHNARITGMTMQGSSLGE
ncbi:MAG: pentapeptide repeat-containing protein [Candidatus Eremiobacteraeota bacterium]|nr:pentapeptide repeat-containing protein [Candidatus Eremiobacteraeota bacterium]